MRRRRIRRVKAGHYMQRHFFDVMIKSIWRSSNISYLIREREL